MEIKTLEDLRTILDLLAKGKAYYNQPVNEGFISISYNKEKNYIEEHIYQGNPYSGEIKERREERTIEELYDYYKKYPDLWEYFKLFSKK